MPDPTKEAKEVSDSGTKQGADTGKKRGVKIASLAANPASRLMQTSSAGYDMAANVLLGIGLGVAVDHFFPRSRPWGFLALMFLGIVSGFWQLYQTQVRRVKKTPAKAADKDKS